MQEGKKTVYVLDSSCLLSMAVPEGRLYTTYFIADEIRSREPRLLLENMAKEKRIEIMQPDDKFVAKADETAVKLGFKLSAADISVAALSLQLRGKGFGPSAVTDDYALQNLLSALGIKYESVQLKGISEKRAAVWKCRGCGRTFKEQAGNCAFCGAETFRKQIRG